MNRLLQIGVYLWVAVLFGTLSCVACAQSRNVSVSVSVLSGSGVGVSQIVVGLIGGTSATGKTDANGQIVLSTTIPPERTKLLVAVVPWRGALDYPDRNADLARYKEVTTSTIFEPFYEVSLDSQQSTYNLTINGLTGVRVSGKVLASAAVLETLTIRSKWSVLGTDPSPTTGEFEITMPQNLSSEAFIWTKQGGEFFAISVSSTQSASNVSIGDITLNSAPSTRIVEVQVSGSQDLKFTPELPKDGMGVACFVSADGSRVFSAGFTREGKVCLRDSDLSPLRLPPGTYYAATGGMLSTGYGLDLWKLLKAGREADVLAAQVPRLVVPNDGATSAIQWTFDAAQAATAIRSIN